jgi:hypothetical protein
MPASTAHTMLVRALQRSRAPGLVLTSWLLCCACGRKEPLPEPPARTYGIPQQRTTNTSTTPPGQGPEANRMDPNRALEVDRRPRFEEPKGPPGQADAPPELKQRDYSAELAALLSKSVPSCLASFKPSAGTVSIQVTAQVMSSGTISRAEAQGSGLTPPILACIKKLAGTLQLNGPVADAPRSVQTQVTLQTTAQGAPNAPQPKAAAEDTNDDERDGDPRDSKVHQVDDDPAEVDQKHDEPTREAPEPPDPKDEQPTDNHTD